MLDGGDELEDGLGLVSEGAVDLGGGEWFVGGGARAQCIVLAFNRAT